MLPGDDRFTTKEPPWPAWVTEFRDHQIDAFERVMDCYGRGADVVFLDAPTGSGKTLIAEMVRRQLQVPGTYICSGLDLQDQFLRDFPYASVLKGRSNYPTEHMPSITCDACPGVAKCVYCDNKMSCPYWGAKVAAIRARVAVVNTAYYLASGMGAERTFHKRKLIVMDEADELEKALMSHVEMRVTGRRAMELGVGVPVKGARVKTVRGWLEDVLGKVVEAAGKTTGDEPEQVKRRSSLKNLAENVASAVEGLEGDEWGNWVREYDDSGNNFVLKPVRVHEQGAKMLWKKEKEQKFLLMSASFVSTELEAASNGVEEAGLKHETVTMDMTFPVENRPIMYRPAANLVYKEMDAEVPKLVDALCEILDKHPGESTLVHTVSYGLTSWVERELKGRTDRDVLVYRKASERAGVLKRFRESPGAVVLAPSFDRGVDLPGDLCRVNVIAKMPYPNLKDRVTEQRMRGENGQLWYAVRVTRSLLQASGRANRSADDWASIYILDKSFGGFWGMWGRKLLPRWFQDAIT